MSRWGNRNGFHMTQIPPIEPMECFYPTIFLSDTIVYNYSKEAVMSASDYVETSYRVCLRNKFENNSTWEGAFYQSEWDKINSSWVIFIFSLYVCCFLCVRIVLYGPFRKYRTLLCHSNISNIKFYMHINSPAWTDKNHLKCEKMRFISKMNEINSRRVIFNF